MFNMESFGQECPRNWEEIAAYLNGIAESRGITEDSEDQEALCDIWEEYWSAYHSGELPEDAPKAITEEDVVKIGFTADGTCNVMLSEDGTLYAETTLPEDIVDEYGERTSPVDEDYGYLALKAAVIRLAEAHGIRADYLEFWYDGQEDYLSDDAGAECDVRTEYRG